MAQRLSRPFVGRKRSFFLSLGVLVAILLTAAVEPVQGNIQSARRADAFVNSIGVGTHLNYSDTAYADYPLIKNKLSSLGVRHIRDRAYLSDNSEFNRNVYGKYRDLAGLGIKSTLTVDPRTPNLESIDKDKIAAIAALSGPSLKAVSGPNEYNKSGDPDWAQNLRAYQRALYNAVKNNPSTKNVPVIGPALGKPYPAKTPDLSAYVDYGNTHPYPGGGYPSNWGLDHYNLPEAREMSGSKPLIATESGYHNAVNSTSRPGVSEESAAKYMPRLYFEYFNRRIARTYAYELIDERPEPAKTDAEQHFGLLRNDGTEKPAFRAMQNLIGLLEDPGPRFNTGSLNYSLSGNTEDIHRTLLQKRDRKFYLVLWREVPSYDTNTGRDLSVPSRKVTLTLNRPIGRATVYRPSQTDAPVRRYASPRSLDLYVPDAPLIVELTPRTR